MKLDLSFYSNKRVLITGHTGFKGSWLSAILLDAGAQITGYSLSPNTEPSIFNLLSLQDKMDSVISDIRDFDSLKKTFNRVKPEIVLHLAAQHIVLESYKSPRYTYETNVMGTVNLLDCVRTSDSVRSVLNVTTDKVYENREWAWGYRENEQLDGYDPYSNSKSCSELVTHSYRSSFLSDQDVAVSTARAGNVIGGGDFAADRIIPDCVRAALKKENISVRNPRSIRPFQHVLDPLFAYLMITQRQYEDISYADCYNVGPDDADCIDTGTLATMFCESWGDNISWQTQNVGNKHEANCLRLDCSKLKSTFDWSPRWHIGDTIKNTVEWYKTYAAGGDLMEITQNQIAQFGQKEIKNV